MRLIDRAKLAWRILRYNPGNLLAHATSELAPMRATGDDMNAAMCDCLEELVLVFASQGHSGFSAAYAINTLESLLRFKPLGPLTGEPDEWNEVGEGMWQNRRCPHVFKDADGSAYSIEGRVFREPSGVCYTSRDSKVPVTFPYHVPDRPEVVDVAA